MTAETNGLAIRVDGVGKQFQIGASRRGSLYDTLARRHRSPQTTSIWALRDISFSVPHGQVLGVLGRNGSGKTTLMKIIARVTAPTEGSVESWGRVAALLQVGAGFHPELTGRDNIWLSGTILGMSRSEIEDLADEIVDFAEIDEFLDTPVKHYSSGMHLRLAFSVSAHLAADIMLIDEALSVGDTAFQRKCLGRIRDLVAAGRTVLFISHSLGVMRNLCDAAIVLDHGRLVFEGQTDDAVTFYEREILGTS